MCVGAGNRIQISGMRNNKSGIFRVSVDDEQPYEGDLYLDDVECTLFVDYYLGNGTHNMTIELLGKSLNVSEGVAITPVLHLTDIVCVALTLFRIDRVTKCQITGTGYPACLTTTTARARRQPVQRLLSHRRAQAQVTPA